MPMSEAAMEGIKTFGHKWKLRIHGVGLHTPVLGNANDALNEGKDYDKEAVEKAVQGIVKIVRKFAEGKESVLRDRLICDADNLEMVEDSDLEDINYYMGELYDTFDYYRILVN